MGQILNGAIGEEGALAKKTSEWINDWISQSANNRNNSKQKLIPQISTTDIPYHFFWVDDSFRFPGGCPCHKNDTPDGNTDVDGIQTFYSRNLEIYATCKHFNVSLQLETEL